MIKSITSYGMIRPIFSDCHTVWNAPEHGRESTLLLRNDNKLKIFSNHVHENIDMECSRAWKGKYLKSHIANYMKSILISQNK